MSRQVWGLKDLGLSQLILTKLVLSWLLLAVPAPSSGLCVSWEANLKHSVTWRQPKPTRSSFWSFRDRVTQGSPGTPVRTP